MRAGERQKPRRGDKNEKYTKNPQIGRDRGGDMGSGEEPNFSLLSEMSSVPCTKMSGRNIREAEQ